MGLDMYLERSHKTQTEEQMEKESEADWAKGIDYWCENYKAKHWYRASW